MPTTKDEPLKKKPKKSKGASVDKTALRYLDMLEFIPREDDVSVEEIKQALERRGYVIDKRTVQRDLNKLAKTFNLQSSRGDGPSKRWSYAQDAPVKFFPSMDEHTALSFQLMQAFLKPLMAPETLDSMEPFFKKSAELLSQRTEVAARWQEKVHVIPLGLPRIPPTVNHDVQKVIYQALLHEQPLRVHYRSRSSEVYKEHLVSPLGLVIRDHVSYLVLVMNKSGHLGCWPLQRFKDAKEDLNAEYSRPDSFNLAAYAKENIGFKMSNAPTVMGESPPLELELRMDEISAVSVAECPVSARQTMSKQADGSFLLSASVPDTHELRCWIRSLGQRVEVLAPGHLRAEIAEEIASMFQRYKLN